MLPSALVAFAAAFAAAVIAELPCLVRTAALYTRFSSPGAVFLGTVLGNALIAGLALFAAHSAREHLAPHTLRYLAAALFFLFGILTLRGGH